jgi:methyltransferase (TIGR00027 family)
MENKPIHNISDTARWVAVYRAMETERPDAHFKDPYARMLAGERGIEIVEKMPRAKRAAWAMIVRTAVFDEIILRLVNLQGVDTVVNLAAGLDSRPYRLALPPTLNWIEVDLPGILDYKEEILRDHHPVCRLERVRLDLSDAVARKELFARIEKQAKMVLVLTEGLLVYLPREEVASLARDLAAQRNFRWWLIDLASPVLLELLNKWFSKSLGPAGVRMQFAPEEGPDFFVSYGWKPVEFRATFMESQRLKREMPMAWLVKVLSLFSSKKRREGFQKVGIVLLERIP